MVKKCILITLLLCSSAYGVYTAPPKDTVVTVGGLGTQANKNTANGGGATKTVWDAGSPSDFINTNGGPITSTANGAFDYGNKTITSVGIGVGVTVGTLCYIDDGNSQDSFFTGRYEATTVADNVLTFVNISLSGSDIDQATGVTCNVGGAIDGLQNALDKLVNNGALYNRYIYDNIATETITATIDVDIPTGAITGSHVRITGYNSTLTAEAVVVITTGQTLANGLVRFYSTSDYTEWKLIDFDGAGKDSSKAAFCVNNPATETTSIVHTFEECKFHGASGDGAFHRSEAWSFVNCEFYLNGGNGLQNSFGSDSEYVACSFHDNDAIGLYDNANVCAIFGNISYDNGKDGAAAGFGIGATGDGTFIANNTSHGNSGDGFSIDDTADGCVVFNNTSVGNSQYGFDLQGNATRPLAYFGYNHSSVNTTAHYSEDVDNTFADLRNGNNKADTTAAASIFTSVADGSEDFTPKSGTDLIDNALDAGTD